MRLAHWFFFSGWLKSFDKILTSQKWLLIHSVWYWIL